MLAQAHAPDFTKTLDRVLPCTLGGADLPTILRPCWTPSMESKLASERHLPHGGLPPDHAAETASPRDIERCFPRARPRNATAH